MAASDALHVTVRGAGGHGSSPQRTRDPISALAEIVSGAAGDGDPPLRRLRPRRAHRRGASRAGPNATSSRTPRPARRPSGRSRPPRATGSASSPRRCAGRSRPPHGLRGRGRLLRRVPADGQRAPSTRRSSRTPSPRSSAPSGSGRWPTRSPAPRTSPACSKRCPAPPRSSGPRSGTPHRGRAPLNHSPRARLRRRGAARRRPAARRARGPRAGPDDSSTAGLTMRPSVPRDPDLLRRAAPDHRRPAHRAPARFVNRPALWFGLPSIMVWMGVWCC